MIDCIHKTECLCHFQDILVIIRPREEDWARSSYNSSQRSFSHRQLKPLSVSRQCLRQTWWRWEQTGGAHQKIWGQQRSKVELRLSKKRRLEEVQTENQCDDRHGEQKKGRRKTHYLPSHISFFFFCRCKSNFSFLVCIIVTRHLQSIYGCVIMRVVGG